MSKNYINAGGITVDGSKLTTKPNKRTFRNAWTVESDTVISVDMDAAKEIWKEKIRRARKPKLEKLDTDFMKALETGSDTTNIVAAKQALRDATEISAIADATTPEELENAIPAGFTKQEILEV
jgi:hypothetical protein